MTMGKSLVSLKSVPIHKTNLMKLKKKKKHILDNVLGYLKSDTYLFSPFVSSERLIISPGTSTGVMVETDPVVQKNLKLVDIFMDYLKSDHHMYAPLIAEELCLNADKGLNYPGADMNRVKEVMKNVTDETRVPNHQTKALSIKNVRLDGYSRGKSTGIKQKLLQKETVKHVVQQKRRFSLYGQQKAG